MGNLFKILELNSNEPPLPNNNIQFYKITCIILTLIIIFLIFYIVTEKIKSKKHKE